VDGLTRTFAFSPIGDPTSGLHAGVGIDGDIALVAADQQLRRNLFALAAVAVLALCAAWFGGDVFILRRARALVATTERLRAGDFSARTGQVRDGSELGQLASSFDEMAETLEHREAERDAAQAELARRNEELESFTYSVSHDLKEPLRTVKTYSQFLLQDYRDAVDADGKEFLEGIGSASVRMARLIDELLLLSRLSKEAPAVRVETNELLEDIVRSLGGAIEAKQATVTMEPGLPAVYAHSERVAQVLTNLISNALKFNDGQTPTVEIGKAAESGGMVTFYVRDNGVGIDAEFHEQIFGLFKRLNRREDYDGTGAGLAIAKRAVEVSGGQIWLESTPGAGSTFFFTLPLWQGAANTLVAA
jgi:light-regulated signal transduction histidine kinase (bacteriophytochrome)